MTDFWPYITSTKIFFDIWNWTSTNLWCVVLYVTYSITYITEVSGSSVWQVSKKYCAGMIYGQKSLMCYVFPINSLLRHSVIWSVVDVAQTIFLFLPNYWINAVLKGNFSTFFKIQTKSTWNPVLLIEKNSKV